MRRLVLILAALLLTACGGLSKNEAKRLIEAKLGDTTVYGMVNYPTFTLKAPNGKTAAEAFEECANQGCVDFRALRDEDMITISPGTVARGTATYQVEFTEAGERYKHNKPKRGFQHVRLGRRVVGSVKDIVKDGDETKAYYTYEFGDATPFAGRVLTWPWGDPLKTDPQDMTAYLVSDGKDWKVRRLRPGTE